MNALKEETPLHIREKSGDDISFTSKTKPAASIDVKKLLAVAAAVIVLAAVGTAAWYFLTRKKDSTTIAQNTNTEVSPITAPAATGSDTTKRDSTLPTAQKPDSVSLKPAVTTPASGYSFKIVFKVTTNKAAALDKMNTLVFRGHKVLMYTTDSVTYKLAEPFNLPLSDTTKVKDSLNRFYYLGKARVELN